jgi:hypothetical protein
MSDGRIDAEARGKVRTWKAAASRRFNQFDRVAFDFQTEAIGGMLLKKSGVGRARAFAKLHKRLAGAGAVLDRVKLDQTVPLAVWGTLKPREAVTVEVAPDSVDPGAFQNCVVIEYLVMGQMLRGGRTGIGMHAGLWTLEVPDHALHRLVQRDRRADIAASLWQAHHAALNAATNAVLINHVIDRDRRFLLPAGEGAFVCTFRAGPDVSAKDRLGLCCRARTWLHSDQMTEAQGAVLLAPAPPGVERLGDGILQPLPLRRATPDGSGRVQIYTRADAATGKQR